MKAKFLFCLGLIVAALAPSAYAVNVELNAFLGQVEYGIPTYPYALTINTPPGMSGKWAMCDDYWHGGAPGDIWKANITLLRSDDLNLVRFPQVGITGYKEGAWLMKQFAVTDQSQWPAINFAVWAVFSNNVPLDPLAESWLDAAEQEAMNGFRGVNFSDVAILTPLDRFDPNLQHPQEYMYFIAPEPGTLMLCTSAVLAVMGGRARRKRGSAARVV